LTSSRSPGTKRTGRIRPTRRRATPDAQGQVEDNRHEEASRLNNSEAGLARYEIEALPRRQFSCGLHLDPQLIWAGKGESTATATRSLPPVDPADRQEDRYRLPHRRTSRVPPPMAGRTSVPSCATQRARNAHAMRRRARRKLIAKLRPSGSTELRGVAPTPS